MPSASSKLLVERRGHVLLVTLNRPEVKNAIDTETARALARALDDFEADPGLSAAVITGAGGTFSSGMDLKAFAGGAVPLVGGRGFGGIAERPPNKPIIAAVEGNALAGGFEIVLSCDLIVAAADARFGLPEVKRGLVAEAGGLLRLPRRIPFHIAMEWALTGDFIPAPEAARLGLVNRLVPAGTAVATALDLAAKISENAPLATAASKQIIVESRDWPRGTEFREQSKISRTVRESEDALEGARAFADKRSPQWRGR